MSITSLFDLPFVDVWEYTPQGNQMPPPLGGGTVRKIRKGVYADKSYYYAWDGKHEGGEWEVYAKSDKAHVGVADPATGGWHAKKGSKPGRSIQVFAVSMRAGGAVAFGPVFVDASSLQDIESAIIWRSAPRAHITTLLEEAAGDRADLDLARLVEVEVDDLDLDQLKHLGPPHPRPCPLRLPRHALLSADRRSWPRPTRPGAQALLHRALRRCQDE